MSARDPKRKVYKTNPKITISVEKDLRWRDVKDMVFESIEQGVPSDFESKKLAQLSIKLLAEKQGSSQLNLSFYPVVRSTLEHLTPDELRKIAIQCIVKCTETEETGENIVPIANKVGVIYGRYFDYRYKGKPYVVSKQSDFVEEEVGVSRLPRDGDLDENQLEEGQVYDIMGALGHIPVDL